MKPRTIYALSAGGLIIIIAFILFIMSVTANNKEIDLRNRIGAQQTVIANYYDKMWKILKQKAGVTDQYKNSFKDIYTGLIAGRYSNQKDGTLLKFIKESNPNFDASLYKDLMNSIEIERTGFYNQQNTLIDLGREHTSLLQKVPSKWFLGGISPIKLRIVTSTKTEQVIASGKDDDISLFDDTNKKK